MISPLMAGPPKFLEPCVTDHTTPYKQIALDLYYVLEDERGIHSFDY